MIKMQTSKLCCLFAISSLMFCQSLSADIWINEFQYNNTSDSNDFVEIVITNDTAFSGPNLGDVVIELHDDTIGATTSLYDSIRLDDAGIIVTSDAFATYYMWKPAEIRNNTINGIALIDIANSATQFLSWGGVMSGKDGFADTLSLTSTDVGFTQDGTTPIGQSIGLIGTGEKFGDFAYSDSLAWTEGAVNSGQSFGTPIPEPSGAILLIAGASALAARRRKR